MAKAFMCSLCHNGILGGGQYLDAESVTYKTHKLTVDAKYRNLVLPIQDIQELTWQRIIFPIATFQTKNGERFRFLIFNKASFCRYFQEFHG